MKLGILILIPLLLAGCGQGDGADAIIAPDSGGQAQSGGRESGKTVQVADLTGLYEARGQGEQRSRMCMTPGPSGATAFGIVIETPAGSCGGAGEAVREGNVLRLTMGGDEACAIAAQIAGRRVTFPATAPAGCEYYCGPGASLAGATFEKTGGTAEDAMRATDLAGDPLCG